MHRDEVSFANVVMAANNAFVVTCEGPRMVAHQAGLCVDPPTRSLRCLAAIPRIISPNRGIR